MHAYGYRSIPTIASAGIAGTILRGSIKNGQVKGQRFHHRLPVNILINRVDGDVSYITVLDSQGRAMARLDSDAIF